MQDAENLVEILRERNAGLQYLFEEKNSSKKAPAGIFSSCLLDCLMQHNPNVT